MTRTTTTLALAAVLIGWGLAAGCSGGSSEPSGPTLSEHVPPVEPPGHPTPPGGHPPGGGHPPPPQGH